MKYTVDQFAEKIKAKYPAYKDKDNKELVNRVLEKYPVYRDQVSFEPNLAQKAWGGIKKADQFVGKQKKALAEGWLHSASLGLKDYPIAAAKTLIGEGRELVTGKDKQSIGERFKSELQGERESRKEALKEAPIAGTIGDIAGYITPGALPAQVGKGIAKIAGKTLAKKFIPKFAQKGISTGVEAGLVEGTKKGLETGSVKEGLKQGAIGAIAGAGMGSASGALGGIVSKTAGKMKEFGEKNVRALLRPGQKGRKQGFDIDNVFKHGVDGNTIEEISAKTKDKMAGLGKELDNLISKQNEIVDIDINKIYQKTLEKFSKEKTKSFGKNTSIRNALAEIGEEIEGLKGRKNISIIDAMDIKRSVGKEAKFIHGEPTVVARSKVYQKFYDYLNDELKNKLPERFQSINKAFTELIPINNAVERRLPIQTSNYPISPMMMLSTVIGGSAGAAQGRDLGSTLKGAALGAAGKYALTSPKVARGVYKASQKLGKIKPKTPKGLKIYGSGKIADIVNREKELDQKRLNRLNNLVR